MLTYAKVLPIRHPSDYLIAIKPNGELVRCFDKNVPESFALITNESPNRFEYYDIKGKLRPQFWAIKRFRGGNELKMNIKQEGAKMTATEKRKSFLIKLTELINRFHAENPELFLRDISIKSGENPTGEKVLLGIEIDVIVQPYISQNDG